MFMVGTGVRSAHRRSSSASYLAAPSVLQVRPQGMQVWGPVTECASNWRYEMPIEPSYLCFVPAGIDTYKLGIKMSPLT